MGDLQILTRSLQIRPRYGYLSSFSLPLVILLSFCFSQKWHLLRRKDDTPYVADPKRAIPVSLSKEASCGLVFEKETPENESWHLTPAALAQWYEELANKRMLEADREAANKEATKGKRFSGKTKKEESDEEERGGGEEEEEEEENEEEEEEEEEEGEEESDVSDDNKGNFKLSAMQGMSSNTT